MQAGSVSLTRPQTTGGVAHTFLLSTHLQPAPSVLGKLCSGLPNRRYAGSAAEAGSAYTLCYACNSWTRVSSTTHQHPVRGPLTYVRDEARATKQHRPVLRAGQQQVRCLHLDVAVPTAPARVSWPSAAERDRACSQRQTASSTQQQPLCTLAMCEGRDRQHACGMAEAPGCHVKQDLIERTWPGTPVHVGSHSPERYTVVRGFCCVWKQDCRSAMTFIPCCCHRLSTPSGSCMRMSAAGSVGRGWRALRSHTTVMLVTRGPAASDLHC